jgi:nitrite reductase/ring-hydroxylating ferredoxin subunit
LGEINRRDDEGYIFAASIEEIEDGRITVITLNDLPIILTRVKGAVQAFSARCPHASGDLTKGEFHRGRIECPEHGYRFDIATGFPVWPPDEVCRLKKYPVKEENGRVLVNL